jgi:hypothetical protein
MAPQTNFLQIRISNQDVALTEEVRVQNEVAAIHLFREALSSYPTHIVPNVYGWATSSPTSIGWILQEYMPGTDPEKPFHELPLESQRKIMSQWATIFAIIQKHPLPPSITGYGGLAFSAGSEIISAPLTIPFGGPFATWQDYYLGIFTKQLEIASATPMVSGWSPPSPHTPRKLPLFPRRYLFPALKIHKHQTDASTRRFRPHEFSLRSGDAADYRYS